jgi:sugar phosphate isomerase/epimerase
MNPLGIFSKVFPRPTFDAVLDAVRAHGISSIQFKFGAGEISRAPEIRDTLRAKGVTVAALSGTFNMIDPDIGRRRENLRDFGPLAEAARLIGAPMVTLCTGTRDPDDMWRAHPDNDAAEAWQDLIGSMNEALALTESSGVMLGVEPEPGNVVSSPRRARALLDEIRHPRLRIVMDAANLLGPDADQQAVLPAAFDLLSSDIALVHAKERLTPGPRLDWDLYFGLVMSYGYGGPVILHGFPEEDAAEAIRLVRSRLQAALRTGPWRRSGSDAGRSAWTSPPRNQRR